MLYELITRDVLHAAFALVDDDVREWRRDTRDDDIPVSIIESNVIDCLIDDEVIDDDMNANADAMTMLSHVVASYAAYVITKGA